MQHGDLVGLGGGRRGDRSRPEPRLHEHSRRIVTDPRHAVLRNEARPWGGESCAPARRRVATASLSRHVATTAGDDTAATTPAATKRSVAAARSRQLEVEQRHEQPDLLAAADVEQEVDVARAELSGGATWLASAATIAAAERMRVDGDHPSPRRHGGAEPRHQVGPPPGARQEDVHRSMCGDDHRDDVVDLLVGHVVVRRQTEDPRRHVFDDGQARRRPEVVQLVERRREVAARVDVAVDQRVVHPFPARRVLEQHRYVRVVGHRLGSPGLRYDTTLLDQVRPALRDIARRSHGGGRAARRGVRDCTGPSRRAARTPWR